MCVHSLTCADFVPSQITLPRSAVDTQLGSYFIKPTIVADMGLDAGLIVQKTQRKLRLLGLHGFRTSGDILQRQLSKWDPSLHDLIDVDCIDAPLPSVGKSDVEGIFEGPYYEWFRFNKDFTEFYYMDEMFSYITDYMKLHGPYDGLIGFSQGAIISGCIAGLQEKGLALQDVPPIRLVVLVAPAQLRAPHLKIVYEEPTIKCPTLAFLGDKDWLRSAGLDALKSFANCTIINHRHGHTVPRLDEAETATAARFLKSQLAAIDAMPQDQVKDSYLTFTAVHNIVDSKVHINPRNEDIYATP